MSQNTNKEHNPKIPLIIDCTLEVLRDHGEQGLSMRKVAAKAGMSLGNLQFYFKNKDELLKGMVDEYFERCAGDFSERLLEREPEGKREVIQFLVKYGMDYAESELGEVFRSLWEMAARNENIRRPLHDYYLAYADELAGMIAPFAKTPAAIPRTVTLLISYFDGHGRISCPLPSDKQDMIEFLTNIIESALEGELTGKS